MIGNTYWTTGITLKYLDTDCWSASLEFFDGGHCDEQSTNGTLHTRYFVPLDLAIDTLMTDAKRIGIEFSCIEDLPPVLFYDGDGENTDYPPPEGWRAILRSQAERIGWRTYIVVEV